MASIKLAYMPNDSNSMIPQYLQDQNMRPNLGSKGNLWSAAPPATPQSSNASMSSVWGSPLSVLPTPPNPGTSSIVPSNISNGASGPPALRSQSGLSVNDSAPRSLAALAADSEPVASNDSTAAASFAPSVSSTSSRLSSRQNSQTDITSPVNIGAGLNSSVGTSSVGLTSSPSMVSLKSSGSVGNEEIINTAIVVKNIPFAIKKEQLIDFMTQLGLPLPYAFNYHFDNGVFRGLAFANFTTAEDTAVVISSLNGRELGGRKLRVEYKKMLPFQERERIEREKRERRGQLEEQHQQINQAKLHLAQTQPQSNSAQSASFSQPPSEPFVMSVPTSAAGSPHASQQVAHVDMNDPEVLQAYSTLLVFQNDVSKSDLVLPPQHASLLPRSQISIVRSLSQKLDLNFQFSEDQGIIISRKTDFGTDTNPYLFGVFKNAVVTPSSSHALPRTHKTNLTPATNPYNPVSALNRWNGVGNLANIGGANLGNAGSMLAPK